MNMIAKVRLALAKGRSIREIAKSMHLSRHTVRKIQRTNTGLAELGFAVKPSASVPFTLDMGFQGYTGIREGVGGSLYMQYEF